MGIQEILSFLQSLGITTKMYPLSVPSNAPSEVMLLEISEGMESIGDVSDIVLSITVRADHPARSEELSLEVIRLLDKVTDRAIGGTQVILIKTQQRVPQYLGVDESGKHYHINNFRVLVS